jgi:hypothetical protein
VDRERASEDQEMSLDVTTEETIKLDSDWSETDGIQIRVIVKDGFVSEIKMTIHDPVVKKDLQFLYPHSNDLNSLRGLRNQLAEILIRLEQELGITHNA